MPSFLTPFSLLLGLLALPIILMYMLRLRRREVRVSSTLLWQQLARDREANAPWQKLKRNLLLMLQLLILALLVFALARPYLPVPSVVSKSVVILLDGSASMQATDVLPNRFEVAKQQIEAVIDSLGSNQMTLIQVGRTPQVLAAATNDKQQLREALAQATASQTTAAWSAAFALAAGAAQGFQDAQIVIVSDGGLPDDLPRLPAETTYVPVGQSDANLAITALATRNTAVGPQLFANIRNEGNTPAQALLSIGVDGVLYDAQQISVPPLAQESFTWQLAQDSTLIVAELSNNPDDVLALDNFAVAVHEGGITNRALLVTEGNLYLEQLYAVLPNIESFKAPPNTPLLDANAEPFDLYVFDGVALPNPLPPADMLIIDPRPNENSDLIRVTGIITGAQQTAAVRVGDSPLLQFVDWSGINIAQLAAVEVEADNAEALVEAADAPLLLTGERNGHRFAVLPFPLDRSDLPLQIAFPILMSNLTNWLNPGRAFDAPPNLQPGDVVTLVPNASTTAVQVLLPDGTIWQTEMGEETTLFAQTDQIGLYQVAQTDANGTRPAGSFAINLFAPSESRVAPRESLSLTAQAIFTNEEDNVGQWEFWPWLAAVAFFVLLVEWWVYHRGTQRPALPNTINPVTLWQRWRKEA